MGFGNKVITRIKAGLAASQEEQEYNNYIGECCLACLKPECNCSKEFEDNELPGLLIFNKIKMAKKIEIVIDYDENAECNKCGELGAMDFVGELLCKNCVAKDVFEDYETLN